MGDGEVIIYKSKYSKLCDELGWEKPDSQWEENMIRQFELEYPEKSDAILAKRKQEMIEVLNIMGL